MLPEATSDGVWSGERDLGRRSSSPPGVRCHSTSGVQATRQASRPASFSFPLEAGKGEMMVLRWFFFRSDSGLCLQRGAARGGCKDTIACTSLPCPVPACGPTLHFHWVGFGRREPAAGIGRAGIPGRRVGRAFREGGV